MKNMNDNNSLDENYVLHTYKHKGMEMKEWGYEGLGLISQSSKVHHLEDYAHIESKNKFIS